MEKQQDHSEITEVILRSVEYAKDFGHESVTLEHLLAALILQDDVRECLKVLGADIAIITDALDDFFTANFLERTGTEPMPTNRLHEVIQRAVGNGMFSSKGKAMPIDLLIHLLQVPEEDSHAVTILQKLGVTAIGAKRHASHGGQAAGPNPAAPHRPGDMDANNQPVEISSPEQAREYIEKYCVNLNVQASEAKIDPLIGRADEVSRIVQITARRTKNNVVLVGQPGTGKTAIAEGLALKIVRSEVPDAIKESTVWSLDIGNLIAGTRFRGDFEERMKNVLKALTFLPNSILFIDEIHTIMGAGAGSQGSLDVANLLKPALAKGTLRCIGSTTEEEFRKHFEKDRALLRRFKKVDVFEPSTEDTKLILRGLRSVYEGFHGVTYTDEALDAAVDLTARYVTNACLPDKAIDIMDAAGARQRVAMGDAKKSVIELADIEFEVSTVARIPAQTVQSNEEEKLVNLEGDLRRTVFGQDQAIKALVDASFVARAGLRETNKPQGCYLFAGPTGVGKTEIAKQLATTLGVKLIRFDMSEYMEKHTVAKMIGSPPGYVGHGEGGAGSGLLTNEIDTNPYCVLLLDEIEKAHPDVFNIFLQVMDDGRLTNSNGKTVDFRNVILIMTTNAGAAEMAKAPLGFTTALASDKGDSILKKMFTPEFRNRLDATVRFNALAPENMIKIVDKFVSALSAMAADRNVSVTLDEKARAWLAQKGYDRAMGARPLARVIHETIKIPLSRMMLVGGLKNGGTVAFSTNETNDGLVPTIV